MLSLDDMRDLVEGQTGWKPSKLTCKNWLQSGKVDGSKIGGRWFANRGSLNALLGKEGQNEVQA